MSRRDEIPDQPYIFGSLLMVANRIDTLLERELRPFDVTAKQWFLSVMIASLFDQPPTIMELARTMGSSHQNVKQVALKLQKKGLLRLEKDPDDGRVTRLFMTDFSQTFWRQTDEAGRDFLQRLFSGLNEMDLKNMRAALDELLENIEQLDTGHD